MESSDILILDVNFYSSKFEPMDKKKQLLLKVLVKLQAYRDLASGLIALVDSKYIDEKTIDGILMIINQSIKHVKWEQEKTKLIKAMDIVQKMKHQEALDHEDAEKLLEGI